MIYFFCAVASVLLFYLRAGGGVGFLVISFLQKHDLHAEVYSARMIF